MKKICILAFSLLLAGSLFPNLSQAQSSEDACRRLCIANSVSPIDPITITSATIVNDCLKLVVQYSGGCMDHKVCLFWNGALAESLPPQAFLKLIHKDPGDPCDAIVTQTLNYNLLPIQDPAYNLIILQIQDGSQTITLNYNY